MSARHFSLRQNAPNWLVSLVGSRDARKMRPCLSPKILENLPASLLASSPRSRLMLRNFSHLQPFVNYDGAEWQNDA